MSVKSTIGNVVNAIWNNALTLQEIRTSGNLTKKVVKAEAIKSLDDNLGSAWSSTASYVAGQYVIYQNYIYRCIKNAAAGTAPTNATYWEKTNLASEITALNSNLAKRIAVPLITSTMNTPGTEQILSLPITDFDFIFLSFTVDSDTTVLQVSSELIPVELIKSNYGKYIYSVGGNLDTKAAVKFTYNKCVRFEMKGNHEVLLGVYGIRF